MSSDVSRMGKPKRLAEAMPSIAAWVASLRDVFGNEMMDDLIRRGRDGEPVFYARENGVTFGTRLPEPQNKNIWRCEGLRDRHICGLCCSNCGGSNPRCPVPEYARHGGR